MPGAKITVGGFLGAQPARVQRVRDTITGLRERFALGLNPAFIEIAVDRSGQLPREPTTSHDALSTPPLIHITIVRPFDNDLLRNAVIFCAAQPKDNRLAARSPMSDQDLLEVDCLP